MKILVRFLSASICTSAAFLLLGRQADAGEPSAFGYYDHYDVGYVGGYDPDDWFFDYYAYEYDPKYCDYDFYTGYSYDADLFDWEQEGLFGPASAEASKNRQAARRAQPETSRARRGFSESPEQERARGSKLRQVSGSILETKLVDVRGTTTRNFIALIQTEKAGKRLIVDLGPVRHLRHREANSVSVALASREEVQLQRGRQIAVEGVVERLQDTQLLVARRIRQEGQTTSIRRTAQQTQAKEQRRLSPAGGPAGLSCEPR